MSGRSQLFLGITSIFGSVFAKGHNTAEVAIEPRPLAPESEALPLGHRPPPPPPPPKKKGVVVKGDSSYNRLSITDAYAIINTIMLMAKRCALSTGNLLRRGLPRNSVDRITDRPDMTSAVYRGRKASTQANKQNIPL